MNIYDLDIQSIWNYAKMYAKIDYLLKVSHFTQKLFMQPSPE